MDTSYIKSMNIKSMALSGLVTGGDILPTLDNLYTKPNIVKQFYNEVASKAEDLLKANPTYIQNISKILDENNITQIFADLHPLNKIHSLIKLKWFSLNELYIPYMSNYKDTNILNILRLFDNKNLTTTIELIKRDTNSTQMFQHFLLKDLIEKNNITDAYTPIYELKDSVWIKKTDAIH